MFVTRERSITDRGPRARKTQSGVQTAISDKFGGRTQTRSTEAIEPIEAIVEQAAQAARKAARGGSKK